MRKLTTRAKTILWAGSGGFLGLLIGIGIMDSMTMGVLVIPWFLLFAIFVGVTLTVGREKKPREKHAVVRAEPARAPQALRLSLSFPEIPDGYPSVLGVEEPVHVHVTVRSRDAAAEGAAVRVTGHLRDGAKFVAGEGVTGMDGTVTLSVRPSGVGELILEAEAVLNEQRGTAEAAISLVRYEEEIERLFGEFRSYAHASLGPDSRSDTARELAEKLRASSGAKSSKALLELARVYELVVYGERKADRRLYLALVGALLTLQQEG